MTLSLLYIVIIIIIIIIIIIFISASIFQKETRSSAIYEPLVPAIPNSWTSASAPTAFSPSIQSLWSDSNLESEPNSDLPFSSQSDSTLPHFADGLVISFPKCLVPFLFHSIHSKKKTKN